MDLFDTFTALAATSSPVDLSAVLLPGRHSDYLGKSIEGGPVFLLRDASLPSYSPAIELKHISVKFHSTCRVTTAAGVVEDQFAVISCDAGVVELHEMFIRCLAAAVEQLPDNASTTDLQRSVQSLLDLFRALGQPGSREVTGLWAELFVIARGRNVAQAMRAWHADQFERFDFSWPSGCLEVKATVKEVRQHEFALEQLQSPLGGAGFVASVPLQALGGGLGVVDLAAEIESCVIGEPVLRQKLWGNIAIALGVDFSERLDRRFDPSYAERSLAVYSMADVPAPEQPNDPRISGVRFRADLTTVASSLAGRPRDVLDALFA